MSIREDSKKIVQTLLNTAVEQGDLRIDYQVNWNQMAHELGLASANYCKICFMYLSDKGCFTPHKVCTEGGVIQIHAAAIDFLEES